MIWQSVNLSNRYISTACTVRLVYLTERTTSEFVSIVILYYLVLSRSTTRLVVDLEVVNENWSTGYIGGKQTVYFVWFT